MSEEPFVWEQGFSNVCLIVGWGASVLIFGIQCYHWARFGWWQSWPLVDMTGDWGATMEWRGIGKVVTAILEMTPLCWVPAPLGYIGASIFDEYAKEHRDKLKQQQ